jgi:hypothetical protein
VFVRFLTEQTDAKNVGFLTPLFEVFDRRHVITLDSHKTDGISVRKTGCRKTWEFPGRAEASLIGRLMAFPEKD